MTHTIETLQQELIENRRVSTLNMTEDNWLELRKIGIGASEAAEAVGVSEYRGQREWTERKLGLVESDFEENYRMKMKMAMGHTMEPVTAEMFARATGLQVQNYNQMVMHPEHDFMLCNIDRRVVGVNELQQAWLETIFGTAVSGPGVVELKNVEFAKEWGKPDNVNQTQGLCTSGEVPDSYYIQVQHQLACMGYEWGFLVVTVNGWDVRWYPILRDEETISDLIDLECEAWGYVEREELPLLDLEHPKAIDALKRMYPGTDGSVIRLPERLNHWHKVKQDADAQISEMKKVSDTAAAQLLAEMKDSGVALAPDGSAYTRKLTKRKGFVVEATEFVVLRNTNRLPKAAEEFLKAEDDANNNEQEAA